MQGLPQFPVLKDLSLRAFLNALLFVLQRQTDIRVFSTTQVWKTPSAFNLPQLASTRTISPSSVQLVRAMLASDATVPVLYGATLWRWVGGDTIEVLDQQGLVDGMQYRLTWQVTD